MINGFLRASFLLTFFASCNVLFLFYSCNPIEKKSETLSSPNNKLIQIDDNHFAFELPKDSEVDTGLQNLMAKGNDALIYLSIFKMSGSKYQNNLFSVSKYVSQEKRTIEDAFIESIKTITAVDLNDTLVDNYYLEDFGLYKVENKVLRYKISKHYDKVYSIMFYFMKDDNSNELYEIKSGYGVEDTEEYKKDVFNFMARVALSARVS